MEGFNDEDEDDDTWYTVYSRI